MKKDTTKKGRSKPARDVVTKISEQLLELGAKYGLDEEDIVVVNGAIELSPSAREVFNLWMEGSLAFLGIVEAILEHEPPPRKIGFGNKGKLKNEA